MDLSAASRDHIERILGRQILPGEHGNVASFSDFSEADIAELKILEQASSILAVGYVLYRLKGKVGLQEVKVFCEEVIRLGIKVEDWLSL